MKRNPQSAGRLRGLFFLISLYHEVEKGLILRRRCSHRVHHSISPCSRSVHRTCSLGISSMRFTEFSKKTKTKKSRSWSSSYFSGSRSLGSSNSFPLYSRTRSWDALTPPLGGATRVWPGAATSPSHTWRSWRSWTLSQPLHARLRTE